MRHQYWLFLSYVSGNFCGLIFFMMLQACSDKPLLTPATLCPKHPKSLTIGTYNVFTGAHDALQTAKVIRSMHADIVVLQELSPKGVILMQDVLKKDFRYSHFSKGVAVLSRFPLKKPRYHQSLYGINGFLIAEVESPKGSLQIVSAHLDPLHLWTTRDKWSLPYQLLWGQSKIHRAEGRQIHAALDKKLPTILAGDFNSATPATIKQWKELGFIDSYAAVTPCSFQRDTLQFELLGINTGRRID
jgi:endonuclease/exonuclease/phosphatase family metal-dependent hydrolase